MAALRRWLRLSRVGLRAGEARLVLESGAMLQDPGDVAPDPAWWREAPLVLPSGTELGHVGVAVDPAADWTAGQDALLSEIASSLVADLDLRWRDALVREAVVAQSVRLERALETMDQGVVLIDADGMVGVMNGRAARLLDQPLEMRPSPDSADEAEVGSRMEARRRDGRVLDVRSVPMPDGGMVQTYADITARRRAEEAMARSEARYRLLAENASDLIALVDADGRAAYVSPSAMALLQREPDALLGTGLALCLHPDDALAFRVAIDDAFATSRPVRCEVRLLRAGGRSMWVEAQLRRATNESSQDEPRLVAVIRDIEERRTRDELLREAMAAARQASEAKGEFLATMSHEIRSPLHAIIGFTALLGADPAIAGGQREHVARIESAGRSLLAIVDDILDFSALDAGAIELAPRVFSLAALVEDRTGLVREQASAKALALHWSIAPDVPADVRGDDRRLGQVLLNLLNNAVKFTVSGAVTLVVDRDGDRVRFTVADTGIGIPGERLDGLFQRFTQADGSISRRFGGSGLGLAIARQLVTLMDGAIDVESRVGEGSRFRVVVPLPAAGPVSVATAPTGQRDRTNTPARVLLVDDLDMNRVLAGATLREAGHHVCEVASGREALARLDEEPFDCVLMDIQMPGIDGVQATRIIRQRGDAMARVPIIAMTAAVMSDQVAAFRDAGLDDHLGKPFRREELLAVVGRWTGRSALALDGAKTPPQAPFFDEGIAAELARLIGEPTLTRMMLQFSERLAELGDRLAADDGEAIAPEVASAVHQLVSASGMLGFRLLSTTLSALETSARQGSGVGRAREAVLAQATAALARLEPRAPAA